MDSNNEQTPGNLDARFGEFFNTAEAQAGTTAAAPVAGDQQQAGSGGSFPGAADRQQANGSGSFPGTAPRDGSHLGDAGRASYQQFRDRVNYEANGSGAGEHGFSQGGVGFEGGASPNFGLQRKVGRRRVIGGGSTLKNDYTNPVKSYKVAAGMQFNDVEELRSDAISRAFAQEILEKLWDQWGLDTSVPELMRKAEDVVFALFAMRTASPDADYDVAVALGDHEVNLNDLSSLLASEEVTRRRFARAMADDIRAYVTEPDNVRLREMLVTELGVKAEYAGLAFDGSTHCSGLSTNQVMFTKQLEHMNLFDTPDVRDRMASNRDLATASFQVNNRRGAFS